MDIIFAGIEAGGTKFVCAVGSGPNRLYAKTTFPTTSTEETLQRTITFLKQAQEQHGKLAAIGVACFGPLDPQINSPTYGYITSTPKPGWNNFDFIGAIRQYFDLPVAFDTDVNGAAWGERNWGAGQDLDTFVYITIGTGIGGGGVTNGRLMHGLLHPEMGHMRIPHDWQTDPFPGVCPFHGDCLEGLASGLAIEKRWGGRAETLPTDHPAWDLEAHYLALGLVNIICVLSPQRIILGGGVMSQETLLPLIRSKVVGLLNTYIQSSQILERINEYIVLPELGSQAGALGAIALAALALGRSVP